MGKRNQVTTRDIAEYAGVSQSTVSMILSGRKNVSFTKETEQKVKDVAAALGYVRPRKKAPALNKSLSGTILVVCPDVSGGYYQTVLHAITEEAQSQGCTVLTALTFRQAAAEETYFNLMEENELFGVISLYPLSRTADANALSRRLPVVSIGEKPEGVRFDSVELDSHKPGVLVADHLAGLGHRKIACISGPHTKKEKGRIRRLAGLRQGFADAGIDPDGVVLLTPSAKTWASYPRTEASYRTGYEMTLKALDSGEGFTGLVGHSDDIAYGILAALTDRGLRVPEDMSVAGFDNSPLSAMPRISLTTVEHAAALKGKRAVELIMEKHRHRDRTGSHHIITRMEYEPSLIVRRTTGPAPKKR
ncbi:MAG: LacI family DNA-binding transcriptional regulator [Eubacterium sp.]|nr:LacI family DNA-binding transcriptional regulator [Eubacterium sp.]